jgi:hypothetical protein
MSTLRIPLSSRINDDWPEEIITNVILAVIEDCSDNFHRCQEDIRFLYEDCGHDEICSSELAVKLLNEIIAGISHDLTCVSSEIESFKESVHPYEDSIDVKIERLTAFDVVVLGVT